MQTKHLQNYQIQNLEPQHTYKVFSQDSSKHNGMFVTNTVSVALWIHFRCIAATHTACMHALLQEARTVNKGSSVRFRRCRSGIAMSRHVFTRGICYIQKLLYLLQCKLKSSQRSNKVIRHCYASNQ